MHYAHGCLHGIPILNTTLDTKFTPEEEEVVLVEIFNQTGGHNWKNKLTGGIAQCRTVFGMELHVQQSLCY